MSFFTYSLTRHKVSLLLAAALLLGSWGWVDASALAQTTLLPTQRPEPGPLAPPPSLSTAQIEALTTTPLESGSRSVRGAAPLEVDLENRFSVVETWAREYLPSEDHADHIGWDGDAGSCDEDSVSAEYAEDVLRRMNFYRAQAGVAADLVSDPVKDAKCAEAALVMSREGKLSHSPQTTFPANPCVTDDADQAAAASNLALGNTGPLAVDRLMLDEGSNNSGVGHRRWILYPRLQSTGNGSIPEHGSYRAAHAQWVIGDFRSAPAAAPVSWPNAGFVPWSIVPNDGSSHPRWSFTYPGADFSDAEVTVTLLGDGGGELDVSVDSRSAGFGDNSLVFRVNGVPASRPSEDRTYRVAISEILDAPWESYSYDVTLIDAADLGFELAPRGPALISVDQPFTYRFDGVDGVDGYDVRASLVRDGNWLEGAEDDTFIDDQTSASLTLRTTGLRDSGSFSFHLAIPSFDEEIQSFVILRSVVASESSELRFSQRLRFVSTSSFLVAQVAVDGSTSWETVWKRFGNNDSGSSSQWDTSWNDEAVAIPAKYVGRPIQVRFLMDAGSLVYLGTSNNHGFFIDDIEVTDSEELVPAGEQVLAAGADSFEFEPSEPGDFVLQVQATIAELAYGYDTPLTVTAIEGQVTTTTSTTTSTFPPQACGDADGNGRVAASDALEALKTAVGGGSCLDAICDVVPPTGVSASDALTILRHAVGLIESLTCQPPLAPN